MAESSRAASMVLGFLLVLEGLGAVLVTILNIVTSRALRQGFLPLESWLVPGAFGALCLFAAFGLSRARSWGRVLAAVAQVLVLAGGVIGLFDSRRAVLWVAVGLGILGLLLLARTARTAQNVR
jgi:uncharacterized membrane protein (UPF0136 family)